MKNLGLLVLMAGAALGLSACNSMMGKPASGVSSSAPNAVSSAASGTTGGGANAFTGPQVSPGSPAGANSGLSGATPSP